MMFHFSTLTCFCRRSQIKVLVEQSVFSSIIILEICCHMKANTKTFWFLNARDRTLKFSVKMNPFKGQSRKLSHNLIAISLSICYQFTNLLSKLIANTSRTAVNFHLVLLNKAFSSFHTYLLKLDKPDIILILLYILLSEHKSEQLKHDLLHTSQT